MLILSIRTDKPEAEVGLFDTQKQLQYDSWQAHRQLAETLHTHIAKILHSVDKDWSDIEAIVVYKGPGSFTGLRIGASVANALASSLHIPIVGTTGQDWLQLGQKLLQASENDQQVIPAYGLPVHITTPKK